MSATFQQILSDIFIALANAIVKVDTPHTAHTRATGLRLHRLTDELRLKAEEQNAECTMLGCSRLLSPPPTQFIKQAPYNCGRSSSKKCNGSSMSTSDCWLNEVIALTVDWIRLAVSTAAAGALVLASP